MTFHLVSEELQKEVERLLLESDRIDAEYKRSKEGNHREIWARIAMEFPDIVFLDLPVWHYASRDDGKAQIWRNGE